MSGFEIADGAQASSKFGGAQALSGDAESWQRGRGGRFV